MTGKVMTVSLLFHLDKEIQNGRAGAMFCHVKPDSFLLGCDTQGNPLIDQPENGEAYTKCPKETDGAS